MSSLDKDSTESNPQITDDKPFEFSFGFEIDNIKTVDNEEAVHSRPCIVDNLSWRILVLKKKETKTLGFYLKCQPISESVGNDWSCHASATLTIVNKKKSSNNFSRKTAHLYCEKENDWGYTSFIALDQLYDSNLAISDSVKFQVSIVADPPILHYVNDDGSEDEADESEKRITMAINNLQNEMKSLNTNLRTQMKSFKADIRQDLVEMNLLPTNLQTELSSFKTSLQKDLTEMNSSLTTNFQTEINSLKTDLRKDVAEIMKELRNKVTAQIVLEGGNVGAEICSGIGNEPSFGELKGFDRDLEVEEIVGANDENQELHFYIKWVDHPHPVMVPAKIANVKCPQAVIRYYEKRVVWTSDPVPTSDRCRGLGRGEKKNEAEKKMENVDDIETADAVVEEIPDERKKDEGRKVDTVVEENPKNVKERKQSRGDGVEESSERDAENETNVDAVVTSTPVACIRDPEIVLAVKGESVDDVDAEESDNSVDDFEIVSSVDGENVDGKNRKTSSSFETISEHIGDGTRTYCVAEKTDKSDLVLDIVEEHFANENHNRPITTAELTHLANSVRNRLLEILQAPVENLMKDSSNIPIDQRKASCETEFDFSHKIVKYILETHPTFVREDSGTDRAISRESSEKQHENVDSQPQ